jgi:hypothetical protein
MPQPIKVVLFLFVLGALLAFLLVECNVPEAGAYERPSESIQLERRSVKALESIAESLKKIERKLK